MNSALLLKFDRQVTLNNNIIVVIILILRKNALYILRCIFFKIDCVKQKRRIGDYHIYIV